jgi:CheY-like chemotaxis protein
MKAKKPKILVIDDSQASFVVFAAIFSSLPFEVINASTGPEALDLIKKENVDLFLINVQMPIMDGFETAYHIRRHPQYLNTPILFITAYDRDQVFARAPQHVMSEEFFYKPFPPDLLLARVEELLTQKSIS